MSRPRGLVVRVEEGHGGRGAHREEYKLEYRDALVAEAQQLQQVMVVHA